MKNNVRWCYDHELANGGCLNVHSVSASRSFLHYLHIGEIEIKNNHITLRALDETSDSIPVSEIADIYRGYDDLFTSALTRPYGAFWSPLRFTYGQGRRIYLIIGYSILWTKNKQWYTIIKDLLQ